MTDLDALHAAIDANPADSLGRLVLADYLDEHGEAELAAGYRALAWLGVRAMPASFKSAHGIRFIRPGFALAGRYLSTELNRCHCLPSAWLAACELERGYEVERRAWVTRDTRREVEDAAARAWSRLTPAQQTAILSPAAATA